MPNRMSDFLEGSGEVRFKGNKRPRSEMIRQVMRTPSKEPGGVRSNRTRADRMMSSMSMRSVEK